jgi:hypothetical protein
MIKSKIYAYYSRSYAENCHTYSEVDLDVLRIDEIMNSLEVLRGDRSMHTSDCSSSHYV